MFIKLGETNQIVNVQEAEEALLDPDIQERFKKVAAGIRKVAPKASDFLYFSAIMMHAAEASALNDDGTPKLYKGEPVKVGWDVNEKTGSWKWKTSSVGLLPYRNQNGDIFPRSELLKAYKNWIR